MIPKILKNFNVTVDGRGYAGRVDECVLPKLTIQTEEHRAGGMDAPVEIDMGMEKLEAELAYHRGQGSTLIIEGTHSEADKAYPSEDMELYIVAQTHVSQCLQSPP